MNSVELWSWLLWSCKRVDFLIWVLLSCCLYSCSLTRDKFLQQQKQERRLELTNSERKVEKTDIKKQVQTTDSTSSNFSLLIKPIGSFTYSEQYGFVGNAEYIMLKGQSFNKQQTSISEKTKAESYSERKMKQVQKTKASVSDKRVAVKRTLPSWLYLLLGLPLIWAIWFFVRKIRAYA